MATISMVAASAGASETCSVTLASAKRPSVPRTVAVSTTRSLARSSSEERSRESTPEGSPVSAVSCKSLLWSLQAWSCVSSCPLAHAHSKETGW
eukprot:2877649-Rhodomonas_salina.1